VKFSREAYIALMTFEAVDRQMFVELFGPLVGLEEEWQAHGASQAELDLVAFDWDYVPVVWCGGNTGLSGGAKRTVIEESSTYLIERDELGRTLKMVKGVSTLPLPLDFPVKDMDSWLQVKPLYTFHEARIDWAAVERARAAQAKGALVVGRIPGGYDTPRQLMGAEQACVGYYEQPELMHDIIQTLTETACQVFERITEHLVIDQLSVHEDMAGKAGPLIGPRQVDQFLKPYFQQVWALLSSRGTRIFDMDTDGNVEALLDNLLECGLNALHPMEAAAGMDIVALRQKYGQQLAMKGGLDKFVLKQDKAAIRRELEYKLQPLMQQGGIVFGLDHRIVNGTPLEQYRYYVETGRALLGLPPRTAARQGWRRMAF